MNRNGFEGRSLVLLGLLLSTYLLSSLFFLVLAPTRAERVGWNGYYTLLVPADQVDQSTGADRVGPAEGATGAYQAEPADQAEPAEETLSASLKRAGFDAVVSREGSSVMISDYNGLEEVPLAEIEGRLAPMDPRLDPFVSSVEELFEAGPGGAYEVYYLASDAGIRTVRAKIESVLSRIDGWQLAETRGAQGFLFLGAFCAVVVLLTLFSRRSRNVTIGGAIPWLGFAATAGPAGFVAATAIYFAWVVLVDTGRRYLEQRLQYGVSEGSRRELLYSALVLAGTWAVVLGLSPERSLEAFSSVLVASVGMAAWTGSMILVLAVRRKGQDHRLFVPVAMRAETPMASAAMRYASSAPWVALIVVAAPYIATLLPQEAASAVPRPVPLAGVDEVGFESLHSLERSSSSGLVDLADYVAHRAYQEGFAFGASYKLPEAGAELSMSRFDESSEGTVRTREVMLRYDEQWLEQTLREATRGDGSIGALLLNGNTPSGVVRSSPAGIYSPRTHPARYSLQALLGFSPFIAFSIRVFLAKRIGVPAPVFRRKRQAA